MKNLSIALLLLSVATTTWAQNVGIGTATPAYRLDIVDGTILEPQVRLYSTVDDVSLRLFSGYVGGGEAYVEFGSDLNGVNGWQWGINDGTGMVLRYGSLGTIGNGFAAPQAEQKMFISNTGRFVLKNDGNSVSDNERLTLIGDQAVDAVSMVFRANDDLVGTTLYDAIRLRSGWHNTAATTWGEQRFSVEGFDGTNWIERLTVKGNGNVGIGVSDPATRLEVDGYTRTGFVTMGMDCGWEGVNAGEENDYGCFICAVNPTDGNLYCRSTRDDQEEMDQLAQDATLWTAWTNYGKPGAATAYIQSVDVYVTSTNSNDDSQFNCGGANDWGGAICVRMNTGEVFFRGTRSVSGSTNSSDACISEIGSNPNRYTAWYSLGQP